MPPRHVYGKRTKAIYDPLAVFGSPQSAESPAKEDAVAELVSQVHHLDITKSGKKDGRPAGRGRRPLGEGNSNGRMDSEVKQLPRKGRRRKAVEVEDKVGITGVPSPAPESTLRDDKENDTPRGDLPSARRELRAARSRASGAENDPIVASTPSSDNLPPTPPPKNIYTQHCQPLLALSSHPMTGFATWSEQLASHFSLTKIAEASFGEVYRISLLEHIPGFSRSDESVFKVIALKAPPSTLPHDAKRRNAALKKADAMSRVEDVANEVKLLQRMSSTPGFTNFRDVRILQGRPPPLFVEAFRSWNEGQRAGKKDASVFPDPGKNASYREDQLWAVIEMQDAGTDLERYIEADRAQAIWTVWDIFWQTTLSLAKGEEAAEFEHRDLHLGNICVRAAAPSSPAAETRPIDPKKKLNFTRLETTIIDYTISRCLMPSHATAYTDLAHPAQTSLFHGDSTSEYQYDIYRYMRGAALLSDPLADYSLASTQTASARAIAAGRDWRAFHPVTNLVWLHFVLYKLLEQVRWPSRQKAPARKGTTGEKEFAEWKRANDLEHKLLKVQSLLDPEVVCGREGVVGSAGDVVALAVSEGWLDVGDVVGEGGVRADFEEGLVGGETEVGCSSEVREKMVGLKVRVDLIEECGLEIAEEEARANTKARKVKGKGVRMGVKLQV